MEGMYRVAGSTMSLVAFLGSAGYHAASWRHGQSDPHANVTPAFFDDLARCAEAAGFDAVFLADSLAIWSDPAVRPVGAIEPAVLAASILLATSEIGVIVTQSTTFNEPFNVARRLSSLDHLGGGRIGWNIVTSATKEAAGNFGLDQIPDHDERYRRADEFVRVCLELWNSWSPDAVIADREGRWADPDLIRQVHHKGRFFSVRGPLDVPPSPQRVPLLVQAGSSEAGMGLAARHADVVFTVQSTETNARQFRRRVRQLAGEAGRSSPIHVLPGLIPVVGSTESEARERLAQLDDMLDPSAGVRQLERSLELPAGALSPDDMFDLELPDPDQCPGNQTYYRTIKEMADAGSFTVREVAQRMSTGRGHRVVVGTPEKVAQAMVDWVVRGAADGYVIMPATLPEGLWDFAEHVVPLLNRVGHLENCAGRTLAGRFRDEEMGSR